MARGPDPGRLEKGEPDRTSVDDVLEELQIFSGYQAIQPNNMKANFPKVPCNELKPRFEKKKESTAAPIPPLALEGANLALSPTDSSRGERSSRK